MAILHKEALEYQRALFELPRFLFTGITIFSTASSFLAREKISQVKGFSWYGPLFLFGIVLTFVAFVAGYSVVAHTVSAMRDANDNEEAESKVEEILSGIYKTFSWAGGSAIVYWLLFITIVTIL